MNSIYMHCVFIWIEEAFLPRYSFKFLSTNVFDPKVLYSNGILIRIKFFCEIISFGQPFLDIEFHYLDIYEK